MHVVKFFIGLSSGSLIEMPGTILIVTLPARLSSIATWDTISVFSARRLRAAASTDLRSSSPWVSPSAACTSGSVAGS
jgi:hypothetical protein